MIQTLMNIPHDILLTALSYVLMGVLALLAVAQRATYWILLIALTLALYSAGLQIETLALIIVAFVAWVLFWQGVSNRSQAQPSTKEGA
jgi:membrane protein implicated in regulation of membrane protease activity